MGWYKDDKTPHGPELVFTFSAVDPGAMECDLWCVRYRRLQREAADLATSDVGVHLFTQVPDRSIALSSVDEDLQSTGDPSPNSIVRVLT